MAYSQDLRQRVLFFVHGGTLTFSLYLVNYINKNTLKMIFF